MRQWLFSPSQSQGRQDVTVGYADNIGSSIFSLCLTGALSVLFDIPNQLVQSIGDTTW